MWLMIWWRRYDLFSVRKEGNRIKFHSNFDRFASLASYATRAFDEMQSEREKGKKTIFTDIWSQQVAHSRNNLRTKSKNTENTRLYAEQKIDDNFQCGDVAFNQIFEGFSVILIFVKTLFCDAFCRHCTFVKSDNQFSLAASTHMPLRNEKTRARKK